MLSTTELWTAALLLIFVVLYVVGTLLRNNQAKRDDIGKNKDDAVAGSIAVKPQKNKPE